MTAAGSARRSRSLPAGRSTSRAKRWAGILAYAASGLAAGLRMRRSRLRIRVGELDWEGEGIGVLLANIPVLRAPFAPRGLTVVPGGSAEDGRLDCCVLTAIRRLDLVRIAAQAFFGGAEDGSGLRRWRGTSVEVEADPPLPIELDGDLAGETPLRATVRAGAVRIAAPPRRVD